MFTILSTYDEWHPDYDLYPDGRAWSGTFPTYAATWAALEAYLLAQQWSRIGGHDPTDLTGCLAPYGHAKALICYGDTTIRNDAETITITQL